MKSSSARPGGRIICFTKYNLAKPMQPRIASLAILLLPLHRVGPNTKSYWKGDSAIDTKMYPGSDPKTDPKSDPKSDPERDPDRARFFSIPCPGN